MAEYADREHYIPLRKSELIDLLCADRDASTDRTLTPEEQSGFRTLCRRMAEYYHLVYFDLLEQIKESYSPFDPDADTTTLRTCSDTDRERQLDLLFADIDRLLERGNFRKLSTEEMLKATESVSAWGINLDIDLSVFERLAVYYRGDTVGTRSRRRLRNWFRTESFSVPVYQRMVVVLKQKASKRLGQNADTRSVFLKFFKDIPKPDIEMLLPGGRLKMPAIEQGKLGASVVGTFGFVAYKVAKEVGKVVINNPLSYYGPFGLVLSYGYKQYAGFQNTKKTYSNQLTQSLYYQNLDNNAGVFFRLIDAAEEQECREAILGYFFLWRYAGPDGWTAHALDDFVEAYLERVTGLKVDFEIADALAKLERLRFVEKVGDRYRATPLDRAEGLLADAERRFVTGDTPFGGG
ncbi:MAG: TMEM143 family protein [Gemmataceae bacterium]